MKVLFINSNEPDYLSDCVFHGLYKILGSDFTHLHDYDFMYQDCKNLNELKNFHGKGFTIWGNLKENFNDNTDIDLKIKKHYFDYIIYGSIQRHSDYLDLVLQHYDKSKIVFIDGEDVVYLSGHYNNKILYFKRELVYDIEKLPPGYKNILPISFSIPKEKITKEKKEKIKKLAFIIPDKKDTYIYNNEKDYYDDYQTSYFGLTFKKAGWDCMRHYEILANYCLPYFKDIEYCPKNIMVNLPKNELIKAKKIYEDFNIDQYYELLDYIFEYTKINLTTENAANYILNTLTWINKI